MKVSDYLSLYEAYLTGRRLKAGTKRSKLHGILYFKESYLRSGKDDLREAEEKDFIEFAAFLKDKELGTGTINQYLSSVRQFFTWLYKNDLILTSIVDLIPSIKARSREKTIFTVVEITLFLDSIEDNLRDRVFFELLYSSGLRASEALQIKWKDVNLRTRNLRVEQGKGNRDRYVPLSKTVSFFLKSFRKTSFKGDDDNYLFPGLYNGHLTYGCMSKRFTRYLTESGIKKEGLTIHSIRHSTATHLLTAGADVRYVSELLGHKSLETTVRYTHPTEAYMRKAYRMYHPRENGYYREIDDAYERELERFRERFKAREDFIRKYVSEG